MEAGNHGIELKPVIKEIVRTQVCFPNIKLLVDRISIVILPGVEDLSKNESFLLLLTDGEKSIQALIKRRNYKSIIYGDVCEGSYILVKKFQLARARRLAQEGQVAYLVLEDFYAIGDDRRPGSAHESFAAGIAGKIKELQTEKARLLETTAKLDQHQEITFDDQGSDTQGDIHSKNKRSQAQPPAFAMTLKDSSTPPCSSLESPSQKKRKKEIALGEIDPNFGSRSRPNAKPAETDSSSSSPKSSFDTAPSRPSSCARSHIRPPRRKNPLAPSSSYGAATTTSAVKLKRPHSAGHPALVKGKESRSCPLPIERPLNIKPLAAFRGYRRRNDIFDVFAVIHSVGDSVIKRQAMPPKRDLRIVDPSTDKKVLLSVFVDPDNFVPAIGTIALIRSVSTHHWEGGMLRIYPTHCEGRDWFQPNPVGIAGCDVEAMRQWWTQTHAEVAEEQRET